MSHDDRTEVLNISTNGISQTDTETKRYSLALWLQMVHSPQAFLNLTASSKTVAELFDDPLWVKRQVGKILQPPDWQQVDRMLEWASAPHHHLLWIQDDGYPAMLKNIALPPPVLSVWGDPALLSDPQIAIVGSRQMSHYGQAVTVKLAQELVAAGLIITSGLAYGIDAEGHRAALNAGGQTIGVLGSGIDVMYPKAHQKLAEAISENGCVVSEFPLGFPPAAFTFPRRNRIISGMSLGVIVVEATHKSGSLITARYAMEQGKDVFAVPGSLNNPTSEGCHWLIREGAHCITGAEDILKTLRPELEIILHRPHVQESRKSSQPNKHKGSEHISKEYLDLLLHIDYDMTPVEIIFERVGGTVAELSSMLLMLELQGKIQAVPGGYTKL
jgi:DNA processing protein